MRRALPFLLAFALAVPALAQNNPDGDADGIVNDRDLCPRDPEDRDGWQDEDGCPDPDNDQDGVLDISDRCPNDPETRNGRADDDGCPD
jgi:hypothetical protein